MDDRFTQNKINEFLSTNNRVTEWDEELGSYILKENYNCNSNELETYDLINRIGELESRIEGLGNNKLEKPTKQQTLLFSAVNIELKKRANNTLTEEERYMIVSNFVYGFDFTSGTLAHKSAGGWVDMILSEIE